jgi:undecaprenyl diphosphate synthase
MSTVVENHAVDSSPRRMLARYVAIISDGSRRWAQHNGLTLRAGQEAAADTVKARALDAVELGVQELTIYSFSTENWARANDEVHALMAMLARRISRETRELHDRGIRVRFIGRREAAPPELGDAIAMAEAMTDGNTALTLFIAFNYGGRAEILDAIKRFDGSTEQEFRACLYAPDMHDPDVIIRTSGERRLSNYLLWQGAYSELVFRNELWPDFTRDDLEESLAEFAARQRRFGGR